jgi:UDP-N-acetylmuramoyl-L-alanyl-D-glutamate--2,6-diaminopimelate ligase
MMALPMDRHAWRLDDLLSGFADADALGDRQVSGLTCDSRAVTPGMLFMACQGPHAHGLGFAEEARRRGACAILAEPASGWSLADMSNLQARLGLPVIGVDGLGDRISAIADRFYGAPSALMETFAVIGTHGKTSVAHALAQVLAAELPCGIVGTIGNGFPGDLKTGTDDELDALGLQKTLEDLRTRGAKAVALGVSFQALEQSRVAAVRFSHAVLTNFSPDRLGESGGTVTASEKTLRLFRSPDLSWAILNLDDPVSSSILAELPPRVAVAGFSLSPDRPAPTRCALRVYAREIDLMPRGLRLRIVCETPRECADAELEAGLIGSVNAANLLAVLAVLLALGLPLERAARELGCIRGVPGRMECFGGGHSPLVVVDEARTPAALETVLVNLKMHRPRRIFTVFGCGGERDRSTRSAMGAVAERFSDGLILTDDNPRGESGEAIIEDILTGLSDRRHVRVERQRGLAIRIAIALAGIGDAVLVAGKGHETIQDMGELKVRFSDRAQVVEALREWREGRH